MKSSTTDYITELSNLPTAVNDLFTTTFNTNINIPITSMLANDIAPNGAVGTGITFISSTFVAGMCNGNNTAYCTLGAKPSLNVPSTGYITVPFTQNSCLQNQFIYCIQTTGDPSSTSCATVTIQYTNCICTTPIDLTFLVDSSGSITATNWGFLLDFISQIVTNWQAQGSLSATGLNVGIVQFGTVAKQIVYLTSSNTVIQAGITWLQSNDMASGTATLLGLQAAVTNVQNTTRKVNGVPPSKVIAVLTDGVSKDPCDCYDSHNNLLPCICVGCGTNGTNLLGTQYCTYNAPTQFCWPCADPVSYAQTINSWVAGVAGQKSTYKIVALGLGDQLYYWNNFGWDQVCAINYDPPNTLAVEWANLSTAQQLLMDASCNI